MDTCTPEQYRQYFETFTVPNAAERQLIADGKVGLVFLPEAHFRYNAAVGYSFETAVVVEEGTGRRLLFVRIDSWDPRFRETAEPGTIDYCIPIAYPGASPRQRLSWTIPFGGAWSDTKEEATVVFEASWQAWFRTFADGLAFSNAGAESAAFMQLGTPQRDTIQAFLA